MSIYRRLNPRLLVQAGLDLGLLHWANRSNISNKTQVYKRILYFFSYRKKLKFTREFQTLCLGVHKGMGKETYKAWNKLNYFIIK